MAFSDWSTTAGSNTSVGGVSIAENMNPSDVNNAMRAIMADGRAALGTKGADIASATTTDLGAVAGLFHDITGTTTITGFGTVSAGIWKVLKFEGALTITHNATSMISPTGADIKIAAGDIVTVTSEGSGNWRIVNVTHTASPYKIGTFSRDVSTASGSQSVTGVGYKPRAVIFLSSFAGAVTSQASIGFSDATENMVLFHSHASTANSFNLASSGAAIYLDGGSGLNSVATVSSMDADGFTVSWVKTGSPTGTAVILYMAFR